jgi:hypothetical protein
VVETEGAGMLHASRILNGLSVWLAENGVALAAYAPDLNPAIQREPKEGRAYLAGVASRRAAKFENEMRGNTEDAADFKGRVLP